MGSSPNNHLLQQLAMWLLSLRFLVVMMIVVIVVMIMVVRVVMILAWDRGGAFILWPSARIRADLPAA